MPPGTRSQYLFNSAPLSFAQAEAACNTAGGHLVAFASLPQQVAAEQCFVNSSALTPSFHRAYWMGLAVGKQAWLCSAMAHLAAKVFARNQCAGSAAARCSPPGCTSTAEPDAALWPNFTWVDRTDATNVHQYQNWGNATLADGSRRLEPNNLSPPELCAAANFSSSYRGAGGWADERCSLALPSMCEVTPQQRFESYTARGGGVFTWHTRLLGFEDAEGLCKAEGGHLATYSSEEEQCEVEQHFVRMVGGGRGWRSSSAGPLKMSPCGWLQMRPCCPAALAAQPTHRLACRVGCCPPSTSPTGWG